MLDTTFNVTIFTSINSMLGEALDVHKVKARAIEFESIVEINCKL